MDRSFKEKVVNGFMSLTTAQRIRVKLVGVIGQLVGLVFAMFFLWWFGYWYFLIFMTFVGVGLVVEWLNTAHAYREARFLDRIRIKAQRGGKKNGD